jgi:pyridoxal phosphate enzyme (YggS family)
MELEKRLALSTKVLPVMVEVNTSQEDSKQGVETEDELFTVVDTIMGSPHLRLNGLMTIGPISRDEKVLRSAFAKLKAMHEHVSQRYDVVLPECSMGMSNDIEEAILEGSTMVRVGTALFGARDT